MKSLLTLALLLTVEDISAIVIHGGYSNSAWIGDNAPKLIYEDEISSRPGFHIGVSHTIQLHEWTGLRLGLSNAARGTRGAPWELPRAGKRTNIDMIEVSALGKFGLPTLYLLAGTYTGIRRSCGGECDGSFSRVDSGIKYGVGVGHVYRGITLALDFIRSQGIRSVFPNEDHFDVYNKGVLFQVGIGPVFRVE